MASDANSFVSGMELARRAIVVHQNLSNPQVGVIPAIMPIFGTASAFVSLVGLTIVMGATAMGIM